MCPPLLKAMDALYVAKMMSQAHSCLVCCVAIHFKSIKNNV